MRAIAGTRTSLLGLWLYALRMAVTQHQPKRKTTLQSKQERPMHKERDCPSSPKSAPLDGNQSFTSHFGSDYIARREVCKLPKGGDAWPEDAAGF